MRRLWLMSLSMAAAAHAAWVPIPAPPMDSTRRDPVSSVVVHGGSMWAFTPAGLHRSQDAGRTWQPVGAPTFPTDRRLFAHGGRVYSAAGCLFATAGADMLRSCDDGKTWSKVEAPEGGPFGHFQGDADLLIARGSWNHLVCSRDRGTTWQACPGDHPAEGSISVLHHEGARVWMGGGMLFFSEDGGRRWSGDSGIGGVPSFFSKQLGWLWRGGQWLGLEASADGGKTWFARNVRSEKPNFEFIPTGLASVGRRLFVSGTYEITSAGIFMSADSGQTWTERNEGLPSFLDPAGNLGHDAGSLVALGQTLLVGTGKGLYRSDDLGVRWRPAGGGAYPAELRGQDPGTIYPYMGRLYVRTVANGRSAWFQSGDTARSWQQWQPGFSNLEYLVFSATRVFGFQVDPDSALRNPIYYSQDGMATWQPLRGPWEGELTAWPKGIAASGSHVVVGMDAASLVKPALFHSRDEGKTWNDSGWRVKDAYKLQSAMGDTRFRSEGWVLSVSRDDGQTWKTALSPWREIQGLAASGGRFLVHAGDSLYVTADEGRTWQRPSLAAGLFRPLAVTALGDLFFAGTREGLRVSGDGLSWRSPGETGLSSLGLKAFSSSGDNFVVLTHGGLFYSLDKAATWKPSASPPPLAGDKRWLASHGGRFFLGDEAGVWVSADSGKSWTKTFPKANTYSGVLRGLAGGPDRIFVASEAGIFRSADFGGTWEQWTKGRVGGGYPCDLAYADGELHAAQVSGDFRFTGSAWAEVELPYQKPHALLVGEGKRLVFSTPEGIFLRASRDAEWLPVGAGLPENTLTALALSEGRVYAGLFSKGLWMNSSLPVSTRPQPPDAILQGMPSIFAAADGGRIFRLRLARPARVRISLHSAAGRTVASAESLLDAGLQDLKPAGRNAGEIFYLLEVAPLDRTGSRQRIRGRVLPP
jgi:photosystem II stability/assembly factor-like uncharacterized protein